MAGMWNAWLEAAGALSHERGAEAGKSFSRMLDPEFWKAGGLSPLLDELQHVFSLPKFADLPHADASMLRSSAAMLDLVGLMQQYLSVSFPLWLAASQRFQAEVAKRAHDGDVSGPGALLDLWNGVLDSSMMEFNRSGDFARIQQRLLRASAQYRLELRKAGERSARVFDMPTRTEMTDVYQRMHEMQRELHKLRREVRALRNGANVRAGNAGSRGT